MPKGTYVSRVVASKYAEGTAYATFDGHRSDDYNVYLYMTTDYGENWKNIGGGVPKSAGTVHVVREHPRNQNLLFAGTEFGLWISWDRGATWSQPRTNFPTVPVDDIAIHPRDNDLVIGTHGRSIWVFDDLTPIEKLDAATLGSDLTLFDVRLATEWRLYHRRWSSGHKKFSAQNPPEGAIVTYYLKNEVPPELPKADDKDAAKAAEPKKEGKAKITVLDKDGKVIREMDGPGLAGMNRVNWDLRYNPPAQPTPEQLEAIQAGYGFGPRGPRVDPGEYTVKVSASGKDATKTLVVEEDPRISLSPGDRAACRDALMKLYELAKTTDKDRKTFTGLRDALAAAQEQWKKEAEKPDGLKIPENIRKAAEALKKKVEDIEPKFARPREALGSAGPPFVWRPDPLPERVQDLLDDVDGYSAVPSGQQFGQLEEFTKLVADASAQLKRLVDEDLAGLNKMMNDAGIPHIRPSAAEPARPGRR